VLESGQGVKGNEEREGGRRGEEAVASCIMSLKTVSG